MLFVLDIGKIIALVSVLLVWVFTSTEARKDMPSQFLNEKPKNAIDKYSGNPVFKSRPRD
jgi:hypothetical protein